MLFYAVTGYVLFNFYYPRSNSYILQKIFLSVCKFRLVIIIHIIWYPLWRYLPPKWPILCRVGC